MNAIPLPSRTVRFLNVSLLVVAVAATAAAQAHAAPGGGQGPCAADGQKLCAGVKPGGGARLKCLVEHEKDLSPACKVHVDQMKAHGQEVTAACSDDAEKLCKGVEPGQGRVIQCLADHESALTPDCKGEVQKAKAKHAEVEKKVQDKRQAAQEACAPDIAKHCSGVQKGEGRIVKCLREHEKEIAPACKAALP